jgi:hypothetical protein
MQNSGLCDSMWRNALDRLSASRTKQLSDSASAQRPGDSPDDEVARKFASIFYSLVFQSLQRTVPRDEEDAMAEGMRGLVARYLPREMAKTRSDPLTHYIRRNLHQGRGGAVDERI